MKMVLMCTYQYYSANALEPVQQSKTHMSAIYTGCEDGNLVAIPDECAISFAQPTRLLITKLKQDDGTPNTISTTADAHKALATYQALMAAVADTKAVLTPRFSDFQMPDGEARTFGSGNQVPDGVPINLGSNPATATGRFFAITAKQEKALKTLSGNLGAYFISSEGQIMGQTDDLDTPTVIKPIPFYNLFIGDVKLGGFDEPDSNGMSLAMFAGWSESRIIFTPTFNPVTDLV